MLNYSVQLKLESLPFWKGVRSKPEKFEHMPFALGWDGRGFINQFSPPEVRNKVIAGYNDQEYTHITAPPGASAWANRLGDAAIEFARSSYGNLSDSAVMEIGAGSLYIAKKIIAEDKASQYLIMDPGIKETSDSTNIVVQREYFTRKTYPNQKFDLVLSVNCLEHIEDPVEFLLSLQFMLSQSKGKAVLIFPDTERMFSYGDLGVILHEHLNYFTMDTAKKLMMNCGFEVLQTKSEFDRLFFFVQAPSSRKDTLSVPTDLPMDEILPLACLNFHQSIQYVRKLVSESLDKGETVAFHGANNSLNNALILAEFAGNKKLHIFDGDESKKGKYIPACPNSICYAGDAVYRDIDRVFIAALSFYTEVKENLISRVGINPSRIHPIFPYR